MLVDVITNHIGIKDFIIKKEEFGGVIKQKGDYFRLINFQIGDVEHFCKYTDEFVKENKINICEFGYEVLDCRGNRLVIH